MHACINRYRYRYRLIANGYERLLHAWCGYGRFRGLNHSVHANQCMPATATISGGQYKRALHHFKARHVLLVTCYYPFGAKAFHLPQRLACHLMLIRPFT